MAEPFSTWITAKPVLEVLQQRHFDTPTPVQEQALPAILDNRDVLIESPTGTGKTYAYLLPICERLDPASKELQALILAPTHELVMQIYREAEMLLNSLRLTAVALIGGANPQRQLEKLKAHPAVVIATPGRLNELLQQRKVKVHQVKTVVVDEADRMMDAGFAGPVNEVLKRLMRDTQRIFCSATLPETMIRLLQPLAKEPVIIRAAKPETEASVLHFYLVSEGRKKVDNLRRLLRLVDAQAAIVFVNKMDRVDEIVDKLRYHHLECRLLHSGASKEERAVTLQQFRERKFPVLITTDVAARGIDIPGVEAVIHFDPAPDADAYIHRSGRVGRMGAAGLVFSLIVPQEQFLIKKFSKAIGEPIVQKEMAFGALIDPEEKRVNKPRQRVKPQPVQSSSRKAKNRPRSSR
ncbi:DEAD/DEAH box helicase [Brevibacillus fulvus]|uniref:Superfamily II DNA/RNA helicase n=1 Tax=Brevibacillus fulvus TaxID=1125967 RepID=A0A938XYE9_9BACL|nr:superfamily II DNA/RNA helicase [Brevibacillus fulvus]